MPECKRDHYLPSPEVCDWLLSIFFDTKTHPTVYLVDSDKKSEIYDCCTARVALGADEMIDVVLPSDGIKMLKMDAALRQRQIELKKQECEDAELALKAEREEKRTSESV